MYKILIVDDESIEREGISFLIEKYKLPLEVAQATNGKTALEYMRTHPIDILLTDVKMPQMDGYHLTKLIKENDETKDIPVVIFSSLVNDEMRVKGEQLGVDAQLSKPEIVKLVEVLDGLLLKK